MAGPAAGCESLEAARGEGTLSAIARARRNADRRRSVKALMASPRLWFARQFLKEPCCRRSREAAKAAGVRADAPASALPFRKKAWKEQRRRRALGRSPLRTRR